MNNFLLNTNQILCEKIDQILSRSKFGSQTNNEYDLNLNQSTICYFPTKKQLYIIEQEDDIKSKQSKYWLWNFSLILKNIPDLKDNIVFQRYEIKLVDENNDEIKIKNNFFFNIMACVYEDEEDLLVLYNKTYIFGI